MVTDHIITAATGYDPMRLLPLVRSLGRIGFAGHFHVLGSPATRGSLEEMLHAEGISGTVYPIRRARWLWENRGFRVLQFAPLPFGSASDAKMLSRVMRYIMQRALPICSYRYVMAGCIVRRLPPEATVLLTDSRDVYFQSDPFSYYRSLYSGKLVVALETRPIDEKNVTYRWLRDVYGEAAARSHLGKPVSCSGTTLGDKLRMEDYLTRMVDEIARHRNRISHTVGYDQGIHNYLLHTGKLSCFVAPENGAGPFLTVQTRPEFSEGGMLKSRDGSLIPIIHQYDRAMGAFVQSEYFKTLVSP